MLAAMSSAARSSSEPPAARAMGEKHLGGILAERGDGPSSRRQGGPLPVQAMESTGTGKTAKVQMMTLSQWGEQLQVTRPSGPLPFPPSPPLRGRRHRDRCVQTLAARRTAAVRAVNATTNPTPRSDPNSGRQPDLPIRQRSCMYGNGGDLALSAARVGLKRATWRANSHVTGGFGASVRSARGCS